jgi:hypothetical protein
MVPRYAFGEACGPAGVENVGKILPRVYVHRRCLWGVTEKRSEGMHAIVPLHFAPRDSVEKGAHIPFPEREKFD